MLSDEDRKRIREEEVFREEVRQALANENRSSRSRLFAFFNSGVGLWLLSTVVVGVFGYAYTQWDAERTKDRQAAAAAIKMDTEIGSRLADMDAWLQGALTSIEHEPEENRPLSAAVLAIGVADYIRTTDQPEIGRDQLSIYPEYRKMSLLTLLQLRESTSDRAETVRKAKAELQRLARDATQHQNEWDSGDWSEVRRELDAFVADIRKTVSGSSFQQWRADDGST